MSVRVFNRQHGLTAIRNLKHPRAGGTDIHNPGVAFLVALYRFDKISSAKDSYCFQRENTMMLIPYVAGVWKQTQNVMISWDTKKPPGMR